MERAGQGRPVTLLITALGGEGGGVMTDWLLAACRAEGLICQATSVPGVAQRTGATSYYLEIFHEKLTETAAEPVMALYPQPGDVDLMVATELAEAARACQNGFVTPDRTVLIASTHRFYLLDEKMGMADSRLDRDQLEATLRRMARRAILGDFDRAARDSGTVINAVLLGAIAGVGLLPLTPAALERAIRDEGKSVDANLRGFNYGLQVARGEVVELRPKPRLPAPDAPKSADQALAELCARVARDYPPAARELATEGVARTLDYQDAAYAELFLGRVDRLLEVERKAGGDGAVAAEAARYLALWMTYEDVIRVAQIKTRLSRLERVRGGAGGKPEQPVVVTEFLKPGLDEFCALLPGSLARPLLAWAERSGRRDKLNVALHIRTSTVFGFALLRLMAGLKRWRRSGHRFAVEQRLIEAWLAAVNDALGRDRALAREIVECARLIKGYGDTHRRGQHNFRRIMAGLAMPALAASGGSGDFYANAAAAIATARKAALADPEGNALDRALVELGAASPAA